MDCTDRNLQRSGTAVFCSIYFCCCARECSHYSCQNAKTHLCWMRFSSIVMRPKRCYRAPALGLDGSAAFSARPTHLVIHKSPRLPEFAGVAQALHKDGDVPHAQPKRLGPRLLIALPAQKPPKLSNQADDGVGCRHRVGHLLLVQDEGRSPLIGLKQQVCW